jgi:hypothetical protein
VQGINDLATPFICVFMSEHQEGPMEGWSCEGCGEGVLLDVEADCYWWVGGRVGKRVDGRVGWRAGGLLCCFSG